MNQDINGVNKAVGGIAPQQGVSMLGLKPADSSVPAVAKVMTDPLFRTITADMSLSPSELKDWMRSDLDSDGAKIISPDIIRAKRAIQAALSEADSEVIKFAVNREWK